MWLKLSVYWPLSINTQQCLRSHANYPNFLKVCNSPALRNLCISTHLYFGSHLIIGSFSFKDSTVQDFRSLDLRLNCRPRSATSPPNSDSSWQNLWTFVASFWQIFGPRGATSSGDEDSNWFIVWKDVPQSDMLQITNQYLRIIEHITSFDDLRCWISYVSDFVLPRTITKC